MPTDIGKPSGLRTGDKNKYDNEEVRGPVSAIILKRTDLEGELLAILSVTVGSRVLTLHFCRVVSMHSERRGVW